MEITLEGTAKVLGHSFDSLSEEMLVQAYGAVATAAVETYNKAVELAQERLHSSRAQYLSGLSLREDNGVFILSLSDEVEHLESGITSFSMLPRLAQGPKSKVSKIDGHRYTIIPLKHNQEAIDVSNPVQVTMATNLRAALKSANFKEVKRGWNKETGSFMTVERLKDDPSLSPVLQGLMRIREYKEVTFEAMSGGSMEGMVPFSEANVTFRTASENQKSGDMWVHPGTHGVQLWPELEQYAQQAMTDAVRSIFG